MLTRHLIGLLSLLLLWSAPAAAQRASAADEELTLYHRLGGYDRIAAVVDGFFERFNGDPALTPFLGGINASEGGRIRQHFIDFACANTGGPCLYHGRTMEAAHEGLAITDHHFDRAIEHFAAALRANEVPQDAAAEFLALLERVRTRIVPLVPR